MIKGHTVRDYVYTYRRHAMISHMGGFLTIRHKEIRNITASSFQKCALMRQLNPVFNLAQEKLFA